MIKSVPKANASFAIGVFLVLAYSASGYLAYHISGPGRNSIIHWVLLVAVASIALAISVKYIGGYKIVELAKDRIKVNYPFRFKKVTYTVKGIANWQETEIKTKSGLYKQVAIRFESGKSLQLSDQENTNYTKVKGYLLQKCKRKEVKQ